MKEIRLERDIVHFLEWYESDTYHHTARFPAVRTSQTKSSQARVLATAVELGSLGELATFVTDRANVETLLRVLRRRLSPGAVRGALYALDDVVRWAAAHELVAATDVAVRPDDKPKANPQQPIRVYTASECATFLADAELSGDVRWWALLATLIESGRRIGELLALEWARLHLDAETPYWDLGNTKSRRQNLMPLSRMLRDDVFTPATIRDLRGNCRAVNNRTYQRDVAVHPFPWRHENVRVRFKRQCDSGGIEYRGIHTFRHTAATRWLAAGVPLHAAAALPHAVLSGPSRVSIIGMPTYSKSSHDNPDRSLLIHVGLGR